MLEDLVKKQRKQEVIAKSRSNGGWLVFSKKRRLDQRRPTPCLM